MHTNTAEQTVAECQNRLPFQCYVTNISFLMGLFSLKTNQMGKKRVGKWGKEANSSEKLGVICGEDRLIMRQCFFPVCLVAVETPSQFSLLRWRLQTKFQEGGNSIFWIFQNREKKRKKINFKGKRNGPPFLLVRNTWLGKRKRTKSKVELGKPFVVAELTISLFISQ